MEQITDYEARALDRLAFQFKNKPKIAAILNAISAEVQTLENEIFNVLTKRSIDTGEGVQLDQIGKIVGQSRGGRTDDEYRVALRARIRINLATGTPDEIIAAMKFIIPSDLVRLTEIFPAAFLVEFTGTLTSEPDVLAAFRAVKPAGVLGILMQVVGNPFTTSFMLTFAADGVRSSDDTFTSATAQFLTNGAQVGDVLHVYLPQTESGEKTISAVVSETEVRVSVAFGVTDAGVEFDVRRNDATGEGFSNLAQVLGGELSNIVYP